MARRRRYVFSTVLFCSSFFCFAYFQLRIIERATYNKQNMDKTAQDLAPKVKTYPPYNTSGIHQVTDIVAVSTRARITSGATVNCSSPNYKIEGSFQEDPQLVDYIRHHMLRPPSPHGYNLENPGKIHFSQEDQSEYADKTYFRGMKDGFFIEAGAVDGEYLSNTLYFERELGWRGLLIEPFPNSYSSLLKKNRKAYSINAALSSTTAASEVSLLINGGIGELSQMMQRESTPTAEAAKGKSKEDAKSNGNSRLFYSIMSYLVPESVVHVETIKVKAVPLYSILLALNVTVVDFLSLDIESFEVKVLQTLPWDKVKFRLMCIEVNHIPEGLEYLKKFLTAKGYKFLGVKQVDAWFGWPKLLNDLR
ncbi:hypothetical protein SK128_014576 [Halocaridina rubra]|uniref:Methyltransferase FkbM domain-containing protein n=1 Tax=Halocaridina rubra TaxID=373956 RepID=A0AAN8XQI5_HALRR